jgi:uncharacterized protein
MGTFLPVLWVIGFISVFGIAQAETNNSDNVVGLLAGEVEWLPQANVLATALAHEDGLRVLPILGAGGVQALQDLSQLEHVDAALVASDSLAYAQQQKLLGGKVAYVARIAPLDVVLIARRELGNVTALAGKRIATGPAQSSGFATGELLFGALEIPFLRVPAQGGNAIAALMGGKADAALVLGTDLAKTALSDPRFHMLSMPLPPQLSDIYEASTVKSQGAKVDTVSVSLTLAVFDWPRGSPHYNVLKRFEAQLFKLPDVATLATDVPGWTRHSSAQDALKQNGAEAASPSLITPTGGQP